MSRTRRFVGAVSVAYISQVVLTAAGFLLTPFLLARVGQHDYGLWLVALQVIGYLSLLDLGVVALLPREVAYAVGRTAEGADRGAELRELVGRVARIVAWQIPAVAIGALLIWMLMPQEWFALRGPMTAILIAFVLYFPTRVLQGVLTGLQDQTFVGWLQLSAWLLGTATMVALVLAGFGLPALASNFAVLQTVLAVGWWWRLKSKFAWALPTRLPSVRWAQARELLGRSLHASVSQIAVMLIAGTDLLIIAKLLGPGANVPYAVTGKLIAVMSNQPQMFMAIAMPGLAELRAGNARGQVYQAVSALGQALLMLSGALFCLVLLVNRSFVDWWVSGSQFGGMTLTALLLLHMMLRHMNSVASFTLFALGGEKRIAYITLADGVVTVVLAIVLVRFLGPVGAPAAGIAGVCLVSLPRNVSGVVRDLDISVVQLVRPLLGWFVRFVPFAFACLVLSRVWPPPTFIGLAAASILVLVAYSLLMAPIVLRPPLGDYARPRIDVAVRKLKRRFGRGGPMAAPPSVVDAPADEGAVPRQ